MEPDYKSGTMRRFGALIYKEFLQLLRDKSSFLMGIVLPLLLILIGYAIFFITLALHMTRKKVES